MGTLDLIQVFVETLDKYFENVCELDLIFHVDRVRRDCACDGGAAEGPDACVLRAVWATVGGSVTLDVGAGALYSG